MLGHLPQGVFALPALRVLDLGGAALAELPDTLTHLVTLEELKLDGALGGLTRLPELSLLPKLRMLKIDGGSGHSGRYPDRSLLAPVFRITTLEVLGIDRWGAQTEYDGKRQAHVEVRPANTTLPDDTFARMPDLRELDLSFNELTTLPESFYTLRRLEKVDLQYTKLDRPTLERLRTTFPTVRLDLRNVKTRFDVDDPNWKAVNAAVKLGSAALRSDREAAVRHFDDALASCTPGACWSDYDELFAYYGLVPHQGESRWTPSGTSRRPSRSLPGAPSTADRTRGQREFSEGDPWFPRRSALSTSDRRCQEIREPHRR